MRIAFFNDLPTYGGVYESVNDICRTTEKMTTCNIIMAFYDLPKEKRTALVSRINRDLIKELEKGKLTGTVAYFTHEDTYIRRNTYLAIGKIYHAGKELRNNIIEALKELFLHNDFRARQTAVNAAGEIGKTDFRKVVHFFDKGLFDQHHSVRNAVIGSLKKMGAVNPEPVLQWAKAYLYHEDKEIRREICHGIELRGRTHPQDILPLLYVLQFDKTSRVRNTLVHVIGQIAYKKDCLPVVVEHLKHWENKQLVSDALSEIIDVHERYKDFSDLTAKEAALFISVHFPAEGK